MVNLYSEKAMIRKIGRIKDNLYDDGFYNKIIVLRTFINTNEDGYFNREMTQTYTDATVNGIVEYGPGFVNHDNVIETVEGDARVTIRAIDKPDESVNEIWLNCTVTNGNIDFTNGVKYGIRSSKPSLVELDYIYVLNIAGRK